MDTSGSPSRPQRIQRPRLVDVLDSIPPGGVGLVVAAAGWGKSVLLEQWLAERSHPSTPGPAVALVRLGSRSADPVVFARQLCRAIGETVPDFDPDIGELVAPGPGGLGPPFLAELSGRLGRLDGPLDIVLDDAHALGADPGLAREAAEALGHMGEHLRLVIASRWEPDVGLHRLRAAGRLVELREADLAFPGDEAAGLIASITGAEPERDEVELLTRRTSGWAVGLSLAAQSMHTMDDPEAFLAGFDGTDRFIAEYLTGEVLNRLKPAVREFLLHTSVLPWLSPELCSALEDSRSAAGAAEALDYLSSRSMFITPADAHGKRLRYHQLFSELLRYQLGVEYPELVGDLRRRASHWLEEHGYVSDAADQLVALDDHEAVLRFARRHGPEYFARSESAGVLAWLDSVARADRPAELLVERMAAQVAAHQSTLAREGYRQARSAPNLTSGQAAALGALYACVGLDDLPTSEIERACTDADECLQEARAAGVEVPDFLGIGGADSVEAMVAYMGAIAEFHRGRLHRAAQRLERALALPGVEYPLWKISALSSLALVRSLAGRHTHAVADAAAAIEVTSEVASEHHHAVTHAHLALAYTAWDRLELDAAVNHLREAEVCAERSGWSVDQALHRMVAARLDWALRGPEAAPARPLFSAAPESLPPYVVCETVACRLRLDALGGNFDYGSELLGLAPECASLRPLEVDLALCRGDLSTAETMLGDWHPDPHDLRDLVGRSLRSAVIHDGTGRRREALDDLAVALRKAEPEGIRSVFAEVPGAVALLRSDDRTAGRGYARSVLEVTTTMLRVAGTAADLVEPLTEREQDLLPYLPTRLTNAEIAAELYISLNTVKSHLRHIYWKLGVDNRDGAVERAGDLGLL
ncbi:MAG: LuxR C-terminal-related transcriptional regulator [Microthrixaceae bacterium]|nr:hypothetical protein [Microthrixaceae bacterium]MCO5316962.1 LuxR C-terminal-related transcriptional regulator [Microthrixaceae bacterium]